MAIDNDTKVSSQLLPFNGLTIKILAY